ESTLVQAWRIHDRLVRYFIEAIPEPGWNSKAEKAKSVGDQFRHIHSVRLMWIKAIEPGALEGLAKLEGDSRPEETTQALRSSCEAIAALVEKAV
ncbi:DinB family protein, partial [Klebsiella aerogenes]|uniref:DinB family protein n=1 Tax=Klebsiella aerogenes TaxID=548 RepID=UPI003799BDBC